LNRFKHIFDSNKVVIDTDMNLAMKPNWDIYKNNHFALRKRCIDIFLKSMTKLIIRH